MKTKKTILYQSRYWAVVVLAFCVLLPAGCEKPFSLQSKTSRLTDKRWKMRSFVNITDNQNLAVPDAIYEFKEDGTFITHPANFEPQYSTWEFLENEEYLRIGSNTFKIKILTKKLLGLRYGEIEIFYVSDKIQ